MSKKTPLVLAMALTFLLLYDLYTVYAWGWDDTISITMFSLSKQAPIVPFLCGVVCGHFFWPQENKTPQDKTPNA